MKQKKIPMRCCVVTKERLPKEALIRIVRTPDNTIEIDLTGKKNGRGAYIKKDKTTIEKAQKSKVLDRHLEMKVEETVYEELKEIIQESNNEK